MGEVAATAFLASALTACDDPDERYDAGYGDGYAAGYNSTCKIRATLVEGDWDNAHYSRGYNRGYIEGSAECLAEKLN